MVKDINDFFRRNDERRLLDDSFKIFLDGWNEGEVRECSFTQVIGGEPIKHAFKLLRRSCSNNREIKKANENREEFDYCEIQDLTTQSKYECPPFFARIHKDNAGRLFIIPCAPDTVIEGEEN